MQARAGAQISATWYWCESFRKSLTELRICSHTKKKNKQFEILVFEIAIGSSMDGKSPINGAKWENHGTKCWKFQPCLTRRYLWFFMALNTEGYRHFQNARVFQLDPSSPWENNGSCFMSQTSSGIHGAEKDATTFSHVDHGKNMDMSKKN